MRQPLNLFFLSIVTVLFIVGCKKKDEPVVPPTGGGGTPQVQEPDAILRARVLWSYGLLEYDSGIAFFGSGPGDLNTMTSVSLNGLALTDQFETGFYTITDGGLSLDNNMANWQVVGDNGFPSFTRLNDEIAFAMVNPITSALIVDLSEGYTLTTVGVSSADSVAFTVGFARKVRPANSSSCQFSAADLASISPGTTGFVVAVSGINYRTEVIGGKRIRFEKERTWAEPVTFVE